MNSFSLLNLLVLFCFGKPVWCLYFSLITCLSCFRYHNEKVLEACKDFILTFDKGIAMLKISEVFPEDAGLYELKAKNEKGETKTVAHLVVKGTGF